MLILKDRSPSASSRPRIEDKLGLTSDNDEDGGVEDKVPSESSENSSTMDDTVISSRKNQEWDFEFDKDEVHVSWGQEKVLLIHTQQRHRPFCTSH